MNFHEQHTKDAVLIGYVCYWVAVLLGCYNGFEFFRYWYFDGLTDQAKLHGGKVWGVLMLVLFPSIANDTGSFFRELYRAHTGR